MAEVAEKALVKAAIMAVLDRVPDPEIPALTITDLGIVRGIAENPPRVLVTPTYTGCPAADPVRWCSYDGGHTASPTDSGQSSSWMPSEVWPFLSQF